MEKEFKKRRRLAVTRPAKKGGPSGGGEKRGK